MRLSLVSGGVKLVDWIRSGADDAGQLSRPAITGLPGLHRGGHTPAGDLTVYPRLSRHLPQPGTCPPRSQHLTGRRHGNLPECHLPEPSNPAIWRHPYRQVIKTRGATRRVVPSLATGWSHAGGRYPSERSHDHGRRLLSIRAPSRHKLGGRYDSHSWHAVRD